MRALNLVLSISLFAALAGPAGADCIQTVTGFHANAVSCDLPHNDLPPSAISAQSLQDAAPFLAAIAKGSLDATTLNDVLREHAVTEDGAKLLRKIAYCALANGDTLGTIPKLTLTGGLGLCPGWSKSPFAGDKQRCLETVSSCVLALVNAADVRVVLSLRGTAAPLDWTMSAVPVQTAYRENSGTPIPSFQPCPKSNPAGIDCGYQPGYVGKCASGEPVTIAVEPALLDSAHGAAGNHVSLRACAGLYGCEPFVLPRAGPWLPEKPPPPIIGVPPHPYAMWIKDGTNSLTFTCPHNGPGNAGTQGQTGTGYYSVMTRSAEGVQLKVSSKYGSYPASETQVFTFEEGGFYGNLFDSQPSICDRAKILTGNQFACFSDGWRYGVDQMEKRLCTLQSGNCFANLPMACSRGALDRCDAQGDSINKIYKTCESAIPAAPQSWTRPITTYLNDPCDLSRPGECNAAAAYPQPPPSPVVPVIQ